MARFEVYGNNSDKSADAPFFLDVQSDVLNGLDSRIVVPLRRRDRFRAISLPANLMPVLDIDGVEYVLEMPELAAVPVRILTEPVTSLEALRFEIRAALDFLF
ncbi:CcdB family protein [Methylomonas sp. UP202]|uniref:CcdB family protein n=1 Tax=Methylomonas sp. UP202 TaxID=3040943 RepID=UPI00247A6FBF|nr:CcdB family protein [Methylomonas sp. UP202]WGS87008.1 CcdB family protein [Methylomonas sp. UP202]